MIGCEETIFKGGIMKSHLIIVLVVVSGWHNLTNTGLFDLFRKTQDKETQTTESGETPHIVKIKGYLVQTNCANGDDALTNFNKLFEALNNVRSKNQINPHNKFDEMEARYRDLMANLIVLKDLNHLTQTQEAVKQKIINIASNDIPNDLRNITSEDDATHE